jgi:phage gp37-like protein
MDFTDIEDAIKGQIRICLPYVKTVETYAGQLAVEIGRITRAFPAVFVAYGGSSFDWIDGRNFSETPEFSVMVAARDLRGRDDLRKGEYGCYRMITDVLSAVTNQGFGLAILPMKPVRVSLILVSKTTAAYDIGFHTSFDALYGRETDSPTG